MKKYLRAFIIGSLFCIAFNYLAVVSLNRNGPILPSNQISSVSYIFLVCLIIFLNPLLNLFRMTVLKTKELIIIATMCIAPAGIAGFGFVTEFIPLAASLNNPQWTEKYQEHIVPNIQSNLYVQESKEAGLDIYNKGLQVRGEEAFPIFIPREGKLLNFPRELVNYFFRGNPDNRTFWGNIPWKQWLPPLFSWSIFFMIVIVFFYALNELLFKQWYVNEKLVFPHTELVQSVLGINRESSGGKLIYAVPAFWFGFSISFLVLLYNGIVNADWLPGLSPISLSTAMHSYVSNTWLEPLGGINLQIYFALIGLGFLLPAEISFSIWFFFLFYQLQAFIAVQSGYAPSVNALGGGFMYKVGFLSAQGGGALIVFSGICLWKVRHNLLAFIYKYTNPSGYANLNKDDIKASAMPSLIFFISSIGIILFFMWAKVGIGFSILYYTAILFLTILCVRLVAESGLISFQLWFGPLHLVQSLGLLKLSFLFKIKSLINAFPIYSSMFLDIKTFMAPAMMTTRALLGNKQQIGFSFPIAIGLGFSISLVVSVITSLTLVYNLGVESMQPWFYKILPNGVVFDTVNLFIEKPDKLSEISLGNFIGVIIGGITMFGLLMARKIFFWVPHPIGMFVYINPIIQRVWFSIFLAWMFKSFCVKYLKRDSYESVKFAFTGIFLGHLFIVCISAIVSILGLGNMNIDLNR